MSPCLCLVVPECSDVPLFMASGARVFRCPFVYAKWFQSVQMPPCPCQVVPECSDVPLFMPSDARVFRCPFVHAK